MRLIYLILICFAAPVAALVAWIRGIRDPSRRERLADRFGRPAIDGGQPTLWVHAASMGEVQAGAELIRKLLTRYPRHRIVMTTMTTTGAARVKALFPERVVHCFVPYDLPSAARRFLDRVRPECAVILETELWPNLIGECVARVIPVVVASARISNRTATRYRRLRGLFSAALSHGVRIATQTDVDAERFRDIGATDVCVTGNIKFDIQISESIRQTGAQLREQIGRRFVWVAGSTHAGEEQAALDAHRRVLATQSDALLILVPRHPQRFEEVRRFLLDRNQSFVTRSSGASTDGASILLVDTMGELLACYAAADLAFVGGSLVPIGGHNLLEPAALGVPVLCGPFVSNAQDVADKLIDAGGALQVTSADQLAEQCARMAADPVERRAVGERGCAVVEANRGAVERTLAILATHSP